MSARTWYAGPPPSVDWWNASRFKDNNCWRFWDGTHWSAACTSRQSPAAAEAVAKVKTRADGIRWTRHKSENTTFVREKQKVTT